MIESGDNSLALVTCDLRSFVSTRVGELAKQKFGVKNTIISVSHTHSGPLTWEARTAWYTEAEDKMVEAIGKAKAAMFPASLEISTGHIYLGFNRRKVEDGRATMWWRNAEKLPSHPLDPTVNALQVKDDAGKTRAVVVNFACHPSVLGPDNLQYSADYPGAMKRYVESQRLPARCVCSCRAARATLIRIATRSRSQGRAFRRWKKWAKNWGRRWSQSLGARTRSAARFEPSPRSRK